MPFVLFPQIKKKKVKRVVDVEEVEQKAAEALKDIQIDEFRGCSNDWEKRLDKCFAPAGEYFESAGNSSA